MQLYTTQFQKNSYDLILAGGSGSNEVKVFDGDSFFEPCYRIFNLSRACYTADFSNSGEMFAIGGGDGVVRPPCEARRVALAPTDEAAAEPSSSGVGSSRHSLPPPPSPSPTPSTAGAACCSVAYSCRGLSLRTVSSRIIV